MHSRTKLTGSWLAVSTCLVWLTACSNPNDPSPDVVSSSNATERVSSEAPVPAPYNPCSEAPDVTSSDVTLNSGRFEPPEVPNVSLSPNAALKVYTSTLKSGAAGLELYVGVCNTSDLYQCSPAMQVEVSDAAGQVLGTVSNAVQSGRLFRVSESPYPISCVAPGEMGMAAVTTFPEGLALTDVASMGHRFSVFQFDEATPLAVAHVSQVEAFEVAGGTAFRGTVTNDSDSPVTDPSVSVFPIDAAGRPLGFVASTAVVEIPPGGDWPFETTAVAERGVGQVAFAVANLPPTP